MEIERKFLVDGSSEIISNIIRNITPSFIVQGYLNTNSKDEYLIRYRSIDSQFFILEIKGPGMLSREELGYPISEIEFSEGFNLCKKKISKHRYSYKEDNIEYEIDLYENYKFITVEIEFETEEESEKFVPPFWIGKEITYDPFYKNINLAN